MSLKREDIDKKFQSQLLIAEILSFVFYGYFFKQLYPNQTSPETQESIKDGINRYSFFQSVHLMVVLGFALLLTFIHRHRMNTMVVCLWVGCLGAQYYFIWNGIWELIINQTSVTMDMNHIIGGEFAAASILIAVCAIIGKASNYQYFLLTMIFMPFYALNEIIVLDVIGARDIGGSIVIHSFGACYGLAVAYSLNYNNSKSHNKNLHASQTSYTSALLGTTLLWALWPAFNAAQTTTALGMNLAVINTYLGLMASVLGTLVTTIMFYNGKFNLDQMANATLAGGVIMGSGADIIQSGFVANFVGFLGGAVSTFLFQNSPSVLQSHGLHDVAGIFNLHCVPGILGGLLSIFYRAVWVDSNSERQLFAVIYAVALSSFVGYRAGIYMQQFHYTETANDFYNDAYFAHLEENIAEKLHTYDSKQGNNEHELFEKSSKKSGLSEKFIEKDDFRLKST